MQSDKTDKRGKKFFHLLAHSLNVHSVQGHAKLLNPYHMDGIGPCTWAISHWFFKYVSKELKAKD